METSGLETVVADVLARHELSGGRLIVGVSGGADSVALLLILAGLRESNRLGIHVAHFDHALRPDSASDAAWVVDLAVSLGVEVTVERAAVSVKGGPAASRSIRSEDAARRARYRFLTGTARAAGAVAILVGHTRDDQVETRLLHLTRGSGLRGLRGMTEESHYGLDAVSSIRVIRPLLTVNRQSTELYCSEHRVKPRLDSTNGEVDYARNRIRHRVVPQLTQINPRFGDALERLGRIAAESDDFIDEELDRQLNGLVEIDEQGWKIHRTTWLPLHRSLKRALLRRAANFLSPGLELGARAIESAIVAADTWNAGRRLTWPGNRLVIIEHDYFEICRPSPPRPLPPDISLDPRALSSVDLGSAAENGWCLNLNSSWRPAERSILRMMPRSAMCPGRDRDRWHVDLDLASLGDASGFSLRSRRDGDWIAPVGILGQKKLQDLFVDARVPESVRDRVPLVTTSGGVAWIVGLRADRRFIAHARSTDVLCIDVTHEMEKDRG